MDEALIRTELRSWIQDRARGRGADTVLDDTPILDRGYLTSLDVAEFVILIESLRNEEIDADLIEPASFTSLNQIWDVFFAGRS